MILVLAILRIFTNPSTLRRVVEVIFLRRLPFVFSWKLPKQQHDSILEVIAVGCRCLAELMPSMLAHAHDLLIPGHHSLRSVRNGFLMRLKVILNED